MACRHPKRREWSFRRCNPKWCHVRGRTDSGVRRARHDERSGGQRAARGAGSVALAAQTGGSSSGVEIGCSLVPTGFGSRPTASDPRCLPRRTLVRTIKRPTARTGSGHNRAAFVWSRSIESVKNATPVIKKNSPKTNDQGSNGCLFTTAPSRARTRVYGWSFRVCFARKQSPPRRPSPCRHHNARSDGSDRVNPIRMSSWRSDRSHYGRTQQ